MIQIVADNIYSPLGFTTADNYAQVKQGHSVLRRYEEEMNLPEPFVASLFDWTKVEPVEGYTRFERICIQSIRRALEQTDVDVCSDKVLPIFIGDRVEELLLRDPGVVYKRVHAAVAGKYFLHHGVRFRALPQIRLHREGVEAPFGKNRGKGNCLFLCVVIVDRDGITGLAQLLCDGSADAPGAACDDYSFHRFPFLT